VPWAAANGLPADIPALAAHPAVLSLIQQVVDEVNVKYARVEQIKKFAILDHDLSVESGELTPTLKVKRRVINEKYADLFDRLYAAGA
jgi:long-chain acyl-CoA synthetase